MRRKLSFITIMILCIALSGCCLEHEWLDASCEKPRTCKVCGETEGEALGHVWLDATCVLPKSCETCGQTEGEPKGHVWGVATCDRLETCSVCGATRGEYAEHVWVEATCLKPRHCEVCKLEEGVTKDHVWVSANYNEAKYCSVCGIIEGSTLEPAFTKRGYEFNIEKGSTWDYKTIAHYDNSSVTATATVTDYRKYKSDAKHPAKEGYEWREATVEFKSETGIKVMLGYTDIYAGLEEYATSDYITYANGTREPVLAWDEFRYEWKDDGYCYSYANLAVRVPETYNNLVFYVSNADYAYTQRIDPNIKFMEMK